MFAGYFKDYYGIFETIILSWTFKYPEAVKTATDQSNSLKTIFNAIALPLYGIINQTIIHHIE